MHRLVITLVHDHWPDEPLDWVDIAGWINDRLVKKTSGDMYRNVLGRYFHSMNIEPLEKDKE